MRWPRIIILLVLFLILGAFLHYTLPQRDIVRIVNTEARLFTPEGWNRFFYADEDAGSAVAGAQRDLRLINTVRPNGNVIVYRNEDTGWVWPPYFKFRSQDLQTEATNLESTATEPEWVAITHYGWRNNFFSIYPNAVSIRPVAGPDVTLVPWLNLIILAMLALILFFIWRLWERFKDRVVDPIMDRTAVLWARMRDWIASRRA
ncbi:MAG: DUF1523 family protein [Rhodobacteraceae bacterium]|nr:DUF1523 family protein [Paracoccaceae bacterium]